MSTRGNVVIQQTKNGSILVNMYHHSDSYPSGLGLELDGFLHNRTIVNGISLDPKAPTKRSNGIDDLAAQVVCLLKGSADNCGGVYICPPRSPLTNPNDYTYIIYPVTKKKSGIDSRTGKTFKYDEATGPLMVTVYHYGDVIFNGSTDKYHKFIMKECNE